MTQAPIAIVWHGRTGAAQALAEAAARGAGEGGVLMRADRATAERLLAASAYLFVCAENLGTMTGAMKEMFDVACYPLLGRVEGRGFATIVAAGSDGHGATAQIERIVTGWRLRRISAAVIVNLAAQSPEAILAAKTVPAAALTQAEDLGRALAEAARLGIC
ncbi:NAD(P)H-dependent oxidoreductase [Parablastomonas sp. CN1-191]|uniref:NAD(P)H-dependent oxidoreductase n=1 Tax=Parablastomonas sp. CN1-191 TaxID=3400908 RepID=UPI003BF8D2A2